jgi:hypothetical protein
VDDPCQHVGATRVATPRRWGELATFALEAHASTARGGIGSAELVSVRLIERYD